MPRTLSAALLAAALLIPHAFAHATTIDAAKPPYSAVGDGKTDCTDALNRALADAGKAVPRASVSLPAGIFAHAAQLYIDGVKVKGAGSKATILRATNPQASTVNLKGDGAELSDVQIDSPSATTRLSCGWQTAITVCASHFRVTGVNIGAPGAVGSPSAGILCLGASFGVISGNTIYRTLADGIHMTSVSHDILVEHNTILKSGDDMIAVVSYLNNRAMAHDITIRHNDCLGETGGRGITVIGGTKVLIDSNRVENSVAGGIHCASESSYMTFGPVDVTITNNTLKNCDTSEKDCHGSIFIYGNKLNSSGAETAYPADRIVIRGNKIEASHNLAIRLGGFTSNISIEDNTIDGAERNAIGLNIWGPANDPDGPENITVRGNTIDHVASPAIFQGPGLKGKIVIENNKIKHLIDAAVGK